MIQSACCFTKHRKLRTSPAAGSGTDAGRTALALAVLENGAERPAPGNKATFGQALYRARRNPNEKVVSSRPEVP
jgi:hypothetical protein